MSNTTQTEHVAPSDPAPTPIDIRASRFRVTTVTGAAYEGVKILPGHIVAAEREYKVRATDIEDGTVPFEVQLYMIWKATRNAGYPDDFDKFLDEVEGVEIVEIVAGTVNPTQPAL